MPLTHKKSKKAFEGNIAELISSFKKSGKIGSSKPDSTDAARKQAIAIAFKIKRGG